MILKKPQIFSNHGTGIMSSDGEAEQEASMLKSEEKRVLVSNAGGQDLTTNMGAKETLRTRIFRSQTLFVSIQLCQKVNILAS